MMAEPKGTSTEILNLLKQYRDRAVPTDFIMKTLGKSKFEILENLGVLKDNLAILDGKDVIELDGENVKLLRKKAE